jgi:hypothetical protein
MNNYLGYSFYLLLLIGEKCNFSNINIILFIVICCEILKYKVLLIEIN